MSQRIPFITEDFKELNNTIFSELLEKDMDILNVGSINTAKELRLRMMKIDDLFHPQQICQMSTS